MLTFVRESTRGTTVRAVTLAPSYQYATVDVYVNGRFDADDTDKILLAEWPQYASGLVAAGYTEVIQNPAVAVDLDLAAARLRMPYLSVPLNRIDADTDLVEQADTALTGAGWLRLTDWWKRGEGRGYLSAQVVPATPQVLSGDLAAMVSGPLCAARGAVLRVLAAAVTDTDLVLPKIVAADRIALAGDPLGERYEIAVSITCGREYPKPVAEVLNRYRFALRYAFRADVTQAVTVALETVRAANQLGIAP